MSRSWISPIVLTTMLLAAVLPATATAAGCPGDGVWLQVLGSGGPETNDGRASSSYLVWHNGHARVLVDIGSGSMVHFDRSGARIEDLSVVLLSHLHVDHSNDLPALVKGSYFIERTTDLPLYGPSDNERMPATTAWLQATFGTAGPYRYLGGFVDGNAPFRLVAHDVNAQGQAESSFALLNGVSVAAVPVHHGPIPALAWRVNLGGKSLVFSGDMSGTKQTLPRLAAKANLLVAHHAVPESAGEAALNLHMPPSVIGAIAAEAKVDRLVLSHRMRRTLGREQESLAIIRQHYDGPIDFAEDMACYQP